MDNLKSIFKDDPEYSSLFEKLTGTITFYYPVIAYEDIKFPLEYEIIGRHSNVHKTNHWPEINVLYDDLLDKNIERKNPTKNIKYKDIHGKVLVIPPTSLPFRRAIYWKGKGAYHYALCNKNRPTLLSAKATQPDWDEIAQKAREESTENTYVFDNFLKF
jgi:hypothetical protein